LTFKEFCYIVREDKGVVLGKVEPEYEHFSRLAQVIFKDKGEEGVEVGSDEVRGEARETRV